MRLCACVWSPAMKGFSFSMRVALCAPGCAGPQAPRSRRRCPGCPAAAGGRRAAPPCPPGPRRSATAPARSRPRRRRRRRLSCRTRRTCRSGCTHGSRSASLTSRSANGLLLLGRKPIARLHVRILGCHSHTVDPGPGWPSVREISGWARQALKQAQGGPEQRHGSALRQACRVLQPA